MRVVTWNVNSIRARSARVLDWLDRHRPDVVLLQETKCDDVRFAQSETEFGRRGYETAHHGTDHRNGVAVLSRVGLDEVRRGFDGPNRPPFDEPRIIAATCAGIRFHSVYVPNGRELDDPHYLYKLVWLERLRAQVDPSRPTLCAGDFNVAPTDADIYDPVRWRRRTHASQPERAAIAALADTGLRDVTREHRPEPGFFTWWSYRPGQFEANRGLRIDLALGSAPVAERVRSVWVDIDERAGERPSDHAPLVIELDP
jgi:exodeoxyribonuclease-3